MKLNSVCSVYIWVSAVSLHQIGLMMQIISTCNSCSDLKIVHNVTLLIMR